MDDDWGCPHDLGTPHILDGFFITLNHESPPIEHRNHGFAQGAVEVTHGYNMAITMGIVQPWYNWYNHGYSQYIYICIHK